MIQRRTVCMYIFGEILILMLNVSAVRWVTQPTNTSVVIGGQAKFECVVEDLGNASYLWNMGPSTLFVNSQRNTRVQGIDWVRYHIEGQNNLVIDDAHREDESSFTCVILGFDQVQVHLTVMACGLNCAKLSANDTEPTCNETNLVCRHGCVTNFDGERCDRCVRGRTGPQCSTYCDYNCQNCTWENGVAGCALCRPEHYYFNKRCEWCRNACLKNSSSDLPTCYQIGGICTFGCINGWYGDQCNAQCGALCINRTCGRDSGCCTAGCKYDTYGGCQCQTPCNPTCIDGTCDQEEACTQGCQLNMWGPKCDKNCSLNCADAPNNTTSRCDRTGVCTFGCKTTFMGPNCSENCHTNCKGNDCNATNGHCLQGCNKDYWKERCNTNCSVNCLQSHSGESICNQDTGACVIGCVNGRFGAICDQNCPQNCINSTCNRYNATCTLGCVEGFTGENCTAFSAPDDRFLPEDESKLPIALIVGILLVLAVTIAVAVFLWKRRKFLRGRSSDRNSNQTPTSVAMDKVIIAQLTNTNMESSDTFCQQERQETPASGLYSNWYQNVYLNKDTNEHHYELSTVVYSDDSKDLYQGLKNHSDKQEHLYETAKRF